MNLAVTRFAQARRASHTLPSLFLKVFHESELRHCRLAQLGKSTLFNSLTKAGMAAENYPCRLDNKNGQWPQALSGTHNDQATKPGQKLSSKTHQRDEGMMEERLFLDLSAPGGLPKQLIRKGQVHATGLRLSTATSSIQSNKDLYGFSGSF